MVDSIILSTNCKHMLLVSCFAIFQINNSMETHGQWFSKTYVGTQKKRIHKSQYHMSYRYVLPHQADMDTAHHMLHIVNLPQYQHDHSHMLQKKDTRSTFKAVLVTTLVSNQL